MTLERIDVAKMSKLVNMLPEDWCEAQLESDQKEHKAVIREIKEGLEKHHTQLEADTIGYPYPMILMRVFDWQEFWQKYGGINAKENRRQVNGEEINT